MTGGVWFLAHRFLVGYVYGRTRSQTGGLLQIWLLKRFASLISLQPILLGLILLTRKLWIEGGVLVGAGLFTLIFVEVYTRLKERSPGRSALNPVSQHALESFGKAAKPTQFAVLEPSTPSIISSGRAARTRGSFASVLEMMSMTLAVEPSHYQQLGPVPISTLLSSWYKAISSHRFFLFLFSDRDAGRSHGHGARSTHAP